MPVSNPDWRPSLLQDLDAGRPLELEAWSGGAVRVGQELGIATPVNFSIYARLRADSWCRSIQNPQEFPLLTSGKTRKVRGIPYGLAMWTSPREMRADFALSVSSDCRQGKRWLQPIPKALIGPDWERWPARLS